ncbi:MAG: hypothetical protein AAF092_17775 [Pseudomonadota bacterium]
MAPVDDLEAEFERSSQSIAAANEKFQNVAAVNQARMGRDRSWIAIIIIATYTVAIFLVIGYVLWRGPSCEAADCSAASALWESQSEYLLNLIFTAVVPVVTLMIGFYFGSEKSAQPPN